MFTKDKRMNPLMIFVLLSLCFSINGCSSNQRLLDSSLSNFENVYTHGKATFVNGELQLISTKNWFFSTTNVYDDFILEAEVMMPNTEEYSNSGIIFRGQIVETEQGVNIVGYQAEIDPSDRKWTGALFDQGRRKWLYPTHPSRSHHDKDFINSYLGNWSDEQSNAYKHLMWNKIKIICKGSDIKIFVNEILTTHVEDLKDSKGVIAFQHHGSKVYQTMADTRNKVRFRNITIHPL